ncbi:MAG: DUF1572 family protein [Bacteroidota bacterium]
MSTFISNYLSSIHKQFEFYKVLGDGALGQLTEAELFWQPDAKSNSIAMIAKHLHGNMLSRWTNFLEADGEKEWRNRDAEFDNDLVDREDILAKWEAGWTCVFEAIDSVNEDNFDQLVYIRNMGHTITEAINRQMTHYAYHVGQIVFLAKLKKGKNWETLSIAKGQSQNYNVDKFAQEKRRAHFTEEFLPKKND